MRLAQPLAIRKSFFVIFLFLSLLNTTLSSLLFSADDPKPSTPYGEKLVEWRRAFTDHGFDEANVLLDPDDSFPTGRFYFGFRSLNDAHKYIDGTPYLFLRRYGYAGKGFYGMNSPDPELLRFFQFHRQLFAVEVNDMARIIDITEGPGAELWRQYRQSGDRSIERFCYDFGIHFIRYKRGDLVFYILKDPYGTSVTGKPKRLPYSDDDINLRLASFFATLPRQQNVQLHPTPTAHIGTSLSEVSDGTTLRTTNPSLPETQHAPFCSVQIAFAATIAN